MNKLRMQFDGRVQNTLSEFNNKRKAVANKNPKCQNCGNSIEEKNTFLFTMESKKIFCNDCEDEARNQLHRDTKQSSSGQAALTEPVLFEVGKN